MVPTTCAAAETRDNTTVDTSPSTPAPATRNKISTPNLGSAILQSGSSNFVWYLPTAGLSPDVAQIIRASWRVNTQSASNTPVQSGLEFCNRWQLNPYQPTVSQVLDFLHTLYESGLSYSATVTHQSAISAIVEIPGVPQLGKHWLVSQFMKGIFHLRLPQPRYSKTWDVNKVLSYLKSLGPNDSLQSIPYKEDELLCPVKCIYAYLTQRSQIVTQDFTEFFITYGKPYHPASKDLLAPWVKEVMGNSAIDTEIFKPHRTRVTSNSAAYP